MNCYLVYTTLILSNYYVQLHFLFRLNYLPYENDKWTQTKLVLVSYCILIVKLFRGSLADEFGAKIQIFAGLRSLAPQHIKQASESIKQWTPYAKKQETTKPKHLAPDMSEYLSPAHTYCIFTVSFYIFFFFLLNIIMQRD